MSCHKISVSWLENKSLSFSVVDIFIFFGEVQMEDKYQTVGKIILNYFSLIFLLRFINLCPLYTAEQFFLIL